MDVERVTQHDRRLGRQKVHDERSRAFPVTGPIDRSTWRDRLIRIWDPLPNPNQCHGECTGVAKCVQLNAVGNRVTGRVLKMDDAHRVYSRNTQIDPWAGSWPPDDTGSSGLASAQAATELLGAGVYRWEFRLADGVVQSIMEGRVLSLGTWWHWNMMDPDADNRIHLGGGMAGGHQYVARGYDVDRDWVLIRCWWGSFRDVWISRADLATLLADGGDAHWQTVA